MNQRRLLKTNEPCLDIGQSTLKILVGNRGVEISLDRLEGGVLNPAIQEDLIRRLKKFLGRSQSPRTALCALPAPGVSLRRMTLPRVSRDETKKLIALQVEKELPLPPESVAWGYLVHVQNGVFPPPEGKNTAPSLKRSAKDQVVTMAAVRREVLEQYEKILAGCGLRPIFSLGVLASSLLCPSVPGHSSILDIGRTHGELLILEDGIPLGVRNLSWGGDLATHEIGQALEIELVQAETIKREWKGDSPTDPRQETIEAALERSILSLARQIQEAWPLRNSGNGSRPWRRLFLLGGGSRLPGMERILSRELGGEVIRVAVEGEGGPGRSAVTLGLRRWDRGSGQNGFLTLRSPARVNGIKRRKGLPALCLWLAIAILLGLTSLILRYWDPLFQLGGLQDNLSRAREKIDALPNADRELSFLTQLEEEQAPFLDALSALARAAPPGTQLNLISLSRRGEVSVQGTLGGYQQASDFRRALISSGWFSQVVVQQQDPVKNKSGLEFRLTARLQAKGSSPSMAEVRESSKSETEPVPAAGEEQKESEEPAPPSISSEETVPSPPSPSSEETAPQEVEQKGKEGEVKIPRKEE